jgi:hypothetical protein
MSKARFGIRHTCIWWASLTGRFTYMWKHHSTVRLVFLSMLLHLNLYRAHKQCGSDALGLFRFAIVLDCVAPALPIRHKPLGRLPETYTAARTRHVRGTPSCRGENTPRSPNHACVRLDSHNAAYSAKAAVHRSGNAMPGAGDKFAAKIEKVMCRREAALQFPQRRFQVQHNICVESVYPSFRRFAGRPMIESSGSALLLVPGRLDVRMSLSSWLTLLTGYLIFESSKQLSDGLP